MHDQRLLHAYRNRILYTCAGLVALLSGVPAVSVAQDTPPATGQASQERPASPDRERTRQGSQGRRERMRIVPVPRGQNASGARQEGQSTSPGVSQNPAGAPQPGATQTPQNPNVPKPEGPPITTLPDGNRDRSQGRDRGGFGGGLGRGGTPFSFDFRGADITNVLRFFAQMSGLTISTAEGLSGQVTIINPKPVTLDEAFKVLQSVLLVRGFTALQNGNVLSIVPIDRGVGQTTVVSPGLNDDGTVTIDPKNQIMTQVIPLDNVDAEALARELAPLVTKGASLIGSSGTNSLILTDTASNVQRFVTLVDALDKTSNNTELMVYPLRYAEATAIADIINNLYRQTTTRGRGGGGQQQGQPGQMPIPQAPGMPGQPGQQGAGAGRPAVIAVADVRTNQVLVVASPANQQQIARDIISRLDDDGANTLDTKPRKIKYADATQVANQVNTILSGMRLGGGGESRSSNPSFQQRVFGGGFGGFGNFGNQTQSTEVVASTDPFAKVTADARTNTVFITATPERMRKIDELIDLLDVDVPVETTTFVIPLKNAQADDVAFALTQAFGTGTGQNNPGFGGFFFGFGGNQRQAGRQPIQRRLGAQNNSIFGRSVRTRSVPPGPPNAPDAHLEPQDVEWQGTTGSAIPQGIPGVMTPNGFVPMDTEETERTRQFPFGGFGGFNQRRLGQNTGPQFGRGRTGTFSNLLQLQNNVFVTPSPYGDSLIVTTTPENYKAITDLIEQLDVVQPQVLIEVIIAEVTLDKNEKLGFALGGRFANLFNRINTGQARVNLPAPGSGTTFNPTAAGTQFTLTGANYDALIQALVSDSRVKVLATPRVFTSNNQQANIEIVTEIPYVTGQNVTAGIGGNILTNETATRNVGYTLSVTPRIARQGLVTIDVISEATDLLRFDELGTGQSSLRLPVVNTRYTDTSVTVMDNETVVIGGLIRDSNTLNLSKIPILSDLPFIGQFFRSRERVNQRVELMVFMTPRVVRSVEEARELTRRQGALILPNNGNLRKIEPNLDPKQKKPPVPEMSQPQGTPSAPGNTQSPPEASGNS
ncbi:MAG: secretin N-terminal domain-containing protein [Chloroherpetonaceae bacterium]|nr:secretin N-terminal domain-containing protein [Chloroherpetonaceae bacterium]